MTAFGRLLEEELEHPHTIVTVNHPIVLEAIRRAPLGSGTYKFLGDLRPRFRNVKSRRLLSKGIVHVDFVEPKPEEKVSAQTESPALDELKTNPTVVEPQPLDLNSEMPEPPSIPDDAVTEVDAGIPVPEGIPMPEAAAPVTEETPPPPIMDATQEVHVVDLDRVTADEEGPVRQEEALAPAPEMVEPVAEAPDKEPETVSPEAPEAPPEEVSDEAEAVKTEADAIVKPEKVEEANEEMKQVQDAAAVGDGIFDEDPELPPAPAERKPEGAPKRRRRRRPS